MLILNIVLCLTGMVGVVILFKGDIMELRVLEYFLAVAREQSISGAADYLHLTQPTLSRQLKDLENELGKQLFLRGKRQITLTDDGMLLRKRAEEIVDLVRKTEKEVSNLNDCISGDIFIGAGESDGFRILAKTAKNIQKEHPNVHFHISSGDILDVLYNLDKGLIDFGLVFGDVDTGKYNCIKFPVRESWGVLMRRDSELADRDFIEPEDLFDKPLLISRQAYKRKEITQWFKGKYQELNIIATSNLIYNASLMVDEGMGYALTFDKLINTSQTNLKFVALKPPLAMDTNLVWKKYQVFSKQSQLFLSELEQEIKPL